LNNVVQFSGRRVSIEVIENLIRLGYLKGTHRHDAPAVDRAMARLQQDLHRDQTISDSDPRPVA
jgi:hypothetical protein